MNLGVRCWSFDDLKTEQGCFNIFMGLLLGISGKVYV